MKRGCGWGEQRRQCAQGGADKGGPALAIKKTHLGIQRDPLPGSTAIHGVEEDGGLANDPALITGEGDGVETIVEVLLLTTGGGKGGGAGQGARG